MATLEDYKRLDVVTPDPSGEGGLAINNNFKKLADRFAFLSTDDPTVDDDSDEGFAVGSRWYNTSSGVEWVCTDDTDGAAVWATVGPGVIKAAIATTSTDGVVVANPTPSTSGVPVQMSPRVRVRGSGWKSNATAASETQDWALEVLPETGAASTSSMLRFGSSNNGSAYVYPLTLGYTQAIGNSIPLLTLSAPSSNTVRLRLGSGTHGHAWLQSDGVTTSMVDGFSVVHQTWNRNGTIDFFKNITTTGEVNSSSTANNGCAFVGGGIRRKNANTTFRVDAGGNTATGTFASILLNPTVDGAWTQTSGTLAGVEVRTSYNQASGTAANTDLLISRTQTAVGSGNQFLVRAAVGGVSMFYVTNNGDVYADGTFSPAGGVQAPSVSCDEIVVNADHGIDTDGIIRGSQLTVNGGAATFSDSGNLSCATVDAGFVTVAGGTALNDTGGIFCNEIEVAGSSVIINGADSGQVVANRLHANGFVSHSEIGATPVDPSDGTETRVYMKADKYVIAYNDGGTMKYRYLDLTSTNATWTYSTTAP